MSLGIEVIDLDAGWGPTVVLEGISLAVRPGGALALLGRNGTGKTTLLATMIRLANHRRGMIRRGGEPIDTVLTHRRAGRGLGYVPPERGIFSSLTVEENLVVAALPGGWAPAQVFKLFPALAERRRATGNLSGGEQQMVAIGRALVGGPKVLLLDDEPLEGLAPIVVETLIAALAAIRDESVATMILAEQKADLALCFAEDAVVLDRGRIVFPR
jgi:branched-chain amino acid transport system ATP-binding protein